MTNWTKEEADELVSKSNPFTILLVLISCAMTDTIKFLWRHFLVLLVFGVAKIARLVWIIIHWIRKDDTSQPSQ